MKLIIYFSYFYKICTSSYSDPYLTMYTMGYGPLQPDQVMDNYIKPNNVI